MDGKSLDTYSNLRFLGECETLKHGADMTVASERTGETILHCILAQQSEGDFLDGVKMLNCFFFMSSCLKISRINCGFLLFHS